MRSYRIRNRTRIVVWGVLFATCLFADRPCYAYQPYCGIFALYGAARSQGVDVEFSDLVDPRFVSSGRGSSVEDLKRAADHIGVDAVTLVGLGRSSLYFASDPLCLHVSPLGIEGTYNHWVLFLGLEEGEAVIHDGVGQVTRCSVESLLARWDGVAIAVTKPGARSFYLLRELIHCMLLVAIVAAVLAVIRHGSRDRCTRLAAQCLVLVTCSITVASGFYFFRIRSQATQNAFAGIDAALGLRDFPELNAAELAEMIREERVLLVDSRFQKDYENGTIKGAINLPVDTGLSHLRNRTQSLPREQPLVVFCQSAECSFSRIVASMLCGEGFEDVRVYREGYIAWTEKHG